MEAAALAGHLLLYPIGLTTEQLPAAPHTLTAASPAGRRVPPGTRTTAPDGGPRPKCAHLTSHPSAPNHQHRPAPAAPDRPFSELPPDHSPVILLHGLADNRSVFAVLRHSLRRHGWAHVHGLNYSPLTADIRTAAADLGTRIEQIRAAYDGERVAVIGHSLGGLIARYYVQRLGGDRHVHTVVTLGTPHSGTLTARLPHLLPVVRQMRPGSPVLAELSAPAPGCLTRFTAIRGELDELILPGCNARLDHPDLAVRNVLVPGVGHLALPIHCGTIAQVREALATGSPAARAAQAPRERRPGAAPAQRAETEPQRAEAS
jgi:hypothetical protein